MMACDRAAPQLSGVVKLGKISPCEGEHAPVFTAVDYEIIEHNTASFTFGGFACRSWKEGVRVETFWTTATDITSFEHPVSMSA
jgi:hypothetical protein